MKTNDLSFIYILLALTSLVISFIWKERNLIFSTAFFAFIILARIEYLIYKIENDKNGRNNKTGNV